jgi:hypothetical protein
MASAPPASELPPSGPAGAPSTLLSPAREPMPDLVLVGLRAVLLGVPLAVLSSATGPYDDPKAWALPILVALTGFLWVVLHRNEPASQAAASSPATRWLGAIVAAYALWWVFTAATGISPAQSISGNFGRGLGLLTFGSAILLFPLVWSEGRSSRAVAALVDAALLGSAPVCVLAFGQAAGWDPLPAAWDPVVSSLRVRSTFGQHIFLGSYLVVLIPLAVARIEWSISEREPGRAVDGVVAPGQWAWAAAWVAGAVGLVAFARRWDFAWWLLVPWGVAFALATARASALRGARGLMPVAFTAALVASQVLVVVLSRARGAFLGLLAGLGVTALALLARRRGPRAAAMAAAGLVTVIAFVAILNVPGSPLEPLRSVPLLSRLGRIADVHHSSPGWLRVQVWRGILDGWQRQLHGEALIPGMAPEVRSLVGYGLEGQLVALDRLALPWLDVLEARGPGWRGQYVVDRAHNVVLDHLVTGGLIGVGLWLLLVASILAVGIARARAATAPGELAIRVGALGAIAAHLVEGQVGIVTPMPQALFWVAAALCTLPRWCERPEVAGPAPPPRTGWWMAAVVAAALATTLVAWLQTQWLLASVAYGAGVRAGIADRPAEAHRSFARSRDLAPWLVLPAEGVAYSALRLASAERDAAHRQALLREAEATLKDLRTGAAPGAGAWMLSGQVAFAQAMAGDRSKLRASLEGFEEAARRRPWDGPLLAQWAWALLEAGDPAKARATAQRAVAGSPRTENWLAWGVLARAARDLGDGAEADRAAAAARSLAPPTARPVLESIISG